MYKAMIQIIAGFLLLILLRGVALAALVEEDSDPYLKLSTSKESVEMGERFHYLITYGNRGPEVAENLTISLNQPLNGRSPLVFIDSSPPPNTWLSSEYGNLAEYLIPALLPSKEATQEGTIKVVIEVRKDVAPQTLTANASLEAPKRELGRRLIVSNTVISHITGGPGFTLGKLKPESSPSADEIAAAKESGEGTGSIETPADDTTGVSLKGTQASSFDWTTLLFMFAVAAVVTAFMAGRRSMRKK